MFHSTHQSFYQNTVPPLQVPWTELFQAKADANTSGWHLGEAQFLNSATNLLLCALGEDDELVSLLHGGVAIRPVREMPGGLSQSKSPACYMQGAIYVDQRWMPYLLLTTISLAHELGHAKRKHDNLPPNGDINRFIVRGQWEDEAHGDELFVNEAIMRYFSELTQEVDSQSLEAWIWELKYYQYNAEHQSAYYRLRATVAVVCQQLAQLAHTDSSVSEPRQSQIWSYADLLIQGYLSQRRSLEDLSILLSAARQTISEYRIPSQLPQVAVLEKVFAQWESQIEIGMLAKNRQEDAFQRFDYLH